MLTRRGAKLEEVVETKAKAPKRKSSKSEDSKNVAGQTPQPRKAPRKAPKMSSKRVKEEEMEKKEEKEKKERKKDEEKSKRDAEMRKQKVGL
jgi:hypothetical protein